MANQPMDISTLLGFLGQNKQPAAAPMNFKNFMMPIPNQDAEKAKQEAKQQASLMAEKASELYGTPGQQQETSPYQMNDNEFMQGENPIDGLMNITKEATQGTNMYDESVPLQQRMMQMNEGMLKSGIPGLQKQWSQNQGNMQNSNMSNIGTMQKAIYDTANPTPGAYEKNASAIYEPGSPEWYQSIKDQMQKKAYADPRETPYSPSDLKQFKRTGGDAIPTNMTPNMMADLGDVTLKNELSSDAAGRMGMLNSARLGFDNIDRLIGDGKGGYNRDVLRDMTVKNVASMFGKLGNVASNYWTSPEGQVVTAEFERGIQAITRVETGAAMPDTELENTRLRFQPISGESDEVIANKIAAYKYFINNARSLIDPIRTSDGTWDPANGARVRSAIDKSFAAVSKNKSTQAVASPSNDAAPEGYTWE